MIFVCTECNDLYRVLTASGGVYARYDSLTDALEAAGDGCGILALADTYPTAVLRVTSEQLEYASAKSLRLFLEYPASVAGMEIGNPQHADWDRVVVASDIFAPSLDPLSILALHGCWFLPAEAQSSHMVAARVAGYTKAVYGLPDETHPILCQLPGHDVLVALSSLSRFVTARYGPRQAWKAIWERLLAWLDESGTVPPLEWSPTVDVQAGPAESLSNSAETEAFVRSVEWTRRNAICRTELDIGVIEGFEAGIDHLGNQLSQVRLRSDCTGEEGMFFAYDWAINRNPASYAHAGSLLDFVWTSPGFRQDNPDSPIYGLLNFSWNNPQFYGDADARVVMPTLAASRLLGDDRWDEHVLRCLLANLRTSGRCGFRERSIWTPSPEYPQSWTFPDGCSWEHLRDCDSVDYSPHYQAYLWAANLWAYALTDWEGFLINTKTAIRMTMEAYPDQWRWTNGMTQEMARMLLPLAFLVRVEDTPEHRQWLYRVASDLLVRMQPCGAIQEEIGILENGTYPPPVSNAAYGIAEAPLIQENGDPVCDLLYTANFAFLGLHEAAAATSDESLKRAEDCLAEFLCRVQIRSVEHKYLDGAWMRSFDYEMWECWGSSSDSGWGAWCVETGWTNTWIPVVMAMRQLGETLFDLSLSDRLSRRFPDILKEMMG